jgi:hypothetical protein
MAEEPAPYEPPTFAEHCRCSPPDVLYHYTGQAGLLGIIGKAELWATKIQYMNDATEFGLALSLARQHLDVIIDSTGHSTEKALAVELRESLRGLEDINIFPVCFCEKSDLLSQWRGYAGNQGYSLAFCTNALMQVTAGGNFLLGRCIYDQTLQRKIVGEAVAHCLEQALMFPTNRTFGFHGPLADILFRCGVFFKDVSFVEEQEWRLVSPTIMFHDKRLKFRPGNSTITPYLALDLSEGAFPIIYVVVGPCPHMELSKSAVTSLLMQRGNRGPLSAQPIAFASAIPFRNW